MSCETIYKCDKCHKQIEPGETIDTNITLSVGHKLVAKGFKQRYSQLKEVCLCCAEKIGIITKVVEGDQVKAVAPQSTQEKLYEVISEIVWENQQGG